MTDFILKPLKLVDLQNVLNRRLQEDSIQP